MEREVKEEVCEQTERAWWLSMAARPLWVVAPMVEQSELSWRLLCRRHGANIAFTPMIHAQMFVKDAHYRREQLLTPTHPLDRPLIVQFCANDAGVLVEAASLAERHCDGVDINLGCPQMIARRGHYGAYLQDDWDLIHRMVSMASERLRVPVSCKIRVFPDVTRTVKYARMLESAGCQMLTVHGRTREQKGHMTGLADWEQIRAVRLAVGIPVLANGNVCCLADAQRLLEFTGSHGVMSAEGVLHNPFLFEGRSPAVWEAASEFLAIESGGGGGDGEGGGGWAGLDGGGGGAREDRRVSRVRSHLYRLWHHALQIHQDLRDELGESSSVEELRRVNERLTLRCQEAASRLSPGEEGDASPQLAHPYWVCQSRLRPQVDAAAERHEEEDDSVVPPFMGDDGA